MAADVDVKILFNDLDGVIQAQLRGQSYAAVRETCDEVLVGIRRRMHERGRGRVYVRGGYTHQASAPGQAPAADTGGLIASYEVGVAMEPSGPVGIVQSDDPNAPRLELGTRHIAARPAVVPSAEAVRQKHTNRMQRVIDALGRR
jgi:hypothetical protein